MLNSILKKQKKMDRQNLRTNGKTKLYRENHTKKHTHTHSQKEKKEKIYISIKTGGEQPNQ